MDWSHRCFYWLQQPYDRQHASTRLNLSSFPFHQPSSRKSFRVSYPPTVLPTFRRNKTNDPSNKHPLGEHKRKFLLISNTSRNWERTKKSFFSFGKQLCEKFLLHYNPPQNSPFSFHVPFFPFVYFVWKEIYIYIFFLLQHSIVQKISTYSNFTTHNIKFTIILYKTKLSLFVH